MVDASPVRSRRWLFVAAVLVAVLATSGTAAAVLPGGGTNAVAACTASPTTVAVGETVTLDASDSDAFYVEFDVDGDGTYERIDETDFVINVSYEQAGTYEPVVRAQDDPTDTASCGTITVETPNDPPTASLSVSPNPATVGQEVTLDASGSTDADGSILAYRWDLNGDGSYERTTDLSTTTTSYDAAGDYVVSVQVEDDDGATATTSRDLQVSRADLVAACTVQPTSVDPGDPVVIDASGSENADYLDYDVDGDGTYEVFERTTFVREVSYDAAGTYTPRVRVYGGGGQRATADCGEVVVGGNTPPTASLTITPRPGVAGESVTFDGSGSSDPDGSIVEYRWDFDGDTIVDRTTTQPTTTHTYSQPDSYAPSLVVVDDERAIGSATRDLRVERDLAGACTVEPRSVAPGETVVIDATALDAGVVDYDLDGDGEYERFERATLTAETSYDEPGTYTPAVRLYVGGQTEVVECDTVTVEEPNEPPTAAFTVDPPGALTGESVTFDASNSADPDGSIVEYRWDFNGDGTVDTTATSPVVQHTFASTGSVVPTLVVVDDDNETGRTSRDLSVERAPDPTEETPDEDEGGIPIVPIGIGGGLAGLGGLLWYTFGGGGGGGGPASDGSPPKPKPKPSMGGDEPARYETGVFALPASSGTVSVPVGFEPDLVLLSATNAARTDTATDRTAGWSRGLAHRTADGWTNRATTVADDAHETDQATCATADEDALLLVRHQPDGAPGRIRARVTGATDAGFEVSVSVPGDDPLSGGIRVLYQAIRTDSDADAAVGELETPTEPGTQTVSLGVDADHVSLLGSAAVTEIGRLWTTDRAVGLTVGQAVAGQGVDQVNYGTAVWPDADHGGGAVCGTDRGLHLLYQDADRLAGRTSASVGGLGETLRLHYDRVYNGPHKLGSTARHVVPYLALDSGGAMRPAVGAAPAPGPGESLSIDCGFEPAMIEVTVAPAPIGEEVASDATPQPFGWSYGTAIADGDRLRQYVLHHAHVPDLPDASVTGGATGTTTGRATADGGVPDLGTEAPTLDPDEIVTDRDPVAAPDESASDASAADTTQAQAPADSPDDGRVGIHLAGGSDGPILARDELRVTGTTATGFEVATRRTETDGQPAGDRPTICYRAWPVAEESDSDGGSMETSDDTDTTGTRQ